MTGKTSAKGRRKGYRRGRILFMTPQTLIHDMKNDLFDIK